MQGYKMRYPGCAVVISALLFLGGCLSNTQIVETMDWNSNEYSTVKPGDWDQLFFSEFYIINNVWGKGTITDYTQWLTKADQNAMYPFGWKWSWPKKNVDQVKGYPSISYGWMPWATSSTNTKLPLSIGGIKDLDIEFDLIQKSTGKYNLSFDLWITKQPGNTQPPEQNIEREIMIWIDHALFQFPKEWFVETLLFDNEKYDFYKASNLRTANYSRDFLVFVRQNPVSKGKLDIRGFLDYLVTNDHIQPSEYLKNVDLGNEIWYGTGETQITGFTVTVNEY